jgi:RNA polymerase sigma-70 factor (ECF subfamily)
VGTHWTNYDGGNASSEEKVVLQNPDSGLERKASVGEKPAFHEIVDQYGNDLYRLAVSLLGNPDDAEDVLQETFLAAFEQLDRFEGRSALKTWLIGILVRRVARHIRYKRIRRTVSLDWLSGEGRDPIESNPAVRRSNEMEIRLDIGTMLKTLSRKLREVLVLREVLNLSYQEIGDALGIPIGTVESRLSRARQELRERYKDYLTG